jgi:hypothetical protein
VLDRKSKDVYADTGQQVLNDYIEG